MNESVKPGKTMKKAAKLDLDLDKIYFRLKDIYESDPIDVQEGNAYYANHEFELVEPRLINNSKTEKSTVVGVVNFIYAKHFLYCLLHKQEPTIDKTTLQTRMLAVYNVMINKLMQNKVIREHPIKKRQQLRVISNDREET